MLQGEVSRKGRMSSSDACRHSLLEPIRRRPRDGSPRNVLLSLSLSPCSGPRWRFFVDQKAV